MLWFRRRDRVEPETRPGPPATLPAGLRIYAFGDVHGRLDLVERLKAAIAADLAAAPVAEALVVGLGDLIDRGPASRGVVDLVSGPGWPTTLVALRGNHEETLLRFLDDPLRHGAFWLRYGGDATLASYGVDRRLLVGSRPDYRAIRDAFVTTLPPAHLLFLQRLPLTHEAGDYFFVHAGAKHGRPLADQAADDLLWIREGFADRDHVFEKIVVHGHTPVDEPFLGRNRINLDTGAYLTGRLSCLVLEGDARRLITI